jgi:hypothetical protein
MRNLDCGIFKRLEALKVQITDTAFWNLSKVNIRNSKIVNNKYKVVNLHPLRSRRFVRSAETLLS